MSDAAPREVRARFVARKRRAPRSFAVKKQKTRVCNFSAEARNDGGQAGAKGDGDGQGRP